MDKKSDQRTGHSRISLKIPQVVKEKSNTLIAIGSSAGGTIAITKILTKLEPHVPAIVITQHIPAEFTKSLTENINRHSSIYVKEAEDGDRLYKGYAVIAHGDYHLEVKHDEKGYFVKFSDDEPVNRFKPSVDVMFNSVAEIKIKDNIGIILTGMGADGSKGLLNMKSKGLLTIAQDEESSAVFGMPGMAIKIGAVEEIKSLEEITEFIQNLTG